MQGKNTNYPNLKPTSLHEWLDNSPSRPDGKTLNERLSESLYFDTLACAEARRLMSELETRDPTESSVSMTPESCL